AKDKKTGKEVTRRIENSSGLSKEDVEKMRREAESHADEDKRKKELADAKNEADTAIWQVEKLLQEQGAQLSDADKAPVQAAIQSLKQAKDGNDLDALRQALN